MSARPGPCGGRSAMIVPTAIANQVRGAPESSLPLPNALKTKKRNTVKGKPPTMDTKPAATECHLMQPHTKSMTAPLKRKVGDWEGSFATIMSEIAILRQL